MGNDPKRQPRIILADSPRSSGTRWVFDQLEKRLHDAGLPPVRYPTTEAFHAGEGPACQADVIASASQFKADRALMASSPNLRAVVCGVTGSDGYDIAAATDLGIAVGIGQSAENSESMAEATILLMLALIYDLRGSEARLRQNLPREVPTRARMLQRKTIGLIGFGQIARAVASRLAAWNVRLLTYIPRTPREPIPARVERVSLEELMAASDIVSIHTSLSDETRGMIDAKVLAQAKPGAFLVNTARGGIVDEIALFNAVQSGRLAGIGFDVFATEPLPPDSPLRLLPNAILTPHAAGHTRELHESQVDAAWENVTRVLAGRLPLHLRNPAVIPAWNARWEGKSLIS